MIPIFLAVLVGLAQYFSDSMQKLFMKHRQRILSITSGIILAYVFLIMLPELYKGVAFLSQLLFIYILIGFIMFYSLEKYIYQHTLPKKRLRELRESHTLVLLLYHVVLGIIFTDMIAESVFSTVLFFIPILLQSTFGMSSIKELHGSVTNNAYTKIFLSSSTLFGVLLASFFPIPSEVYHAALGFVAGALLYIVIREEVPSEKRGSPTTFLFSLACYTVLIILDWYFF